MLEKELRILNKDIVKPENKVKIDIFEARNQKNNKYAYPPVLAQIDNYFYPVTRMPANGKTRCLILKSNDYSEYVLFACANKQNLSTAEKAKATANYISFNKSLKHASAYLNPLIEEKNSQKISNKLFEISKMPFEILQIIHNKNINLQKAFELTLIPENDLIYFSKIITRCKLTSSEISIVSEMMHEICKRENTVFENVIKESFSGGKNELINYIRSLRFPEYEKFKASFDKALKKLSLPKMSALKYEPDFESRFIELLIKFDSSEKLKEQTQKINSIIEADGFKEIFSLLSNYTIIL